MKHLLFFFFGLIIFCQNIYGQCSDAGFCSAGSLNHIENTEEDSSSSENLTRHSVSLVNLVGIGERKTIIYSPQIEINYGLKKNTVIQVKIPYYIASGNLGTTSSLGDIFITGIYSAYKTDKKNFKINLGTRIAVNQSDIKNSDKLPLPMPYQSSLGTNDLIIGASFQYQLWLFAVGYQQPIINNNNNSFLKKDYPSDSKAQTYFESNQFQRKGDAMVRIEKNFKLKKSLFNIGLLPIYHLGDDTYIDSTNTRVSITGSKGLTLNGTVGYNYEITKKLDINFKIGAPLIARKARPDGLTRQFVVTLSLSYKF